MNRSVEKIPSLKKSVSITILCIVVFPFFWFCFLDFPMLTLSKVMARKFAQIGLYINLISALSMIVRYLWLKQYKKRLGEIYKLDDALIAQHEHITHLIFDQESKNKADKDLTFDQSKLYEELSNLFKFEKVESIHMIIGIVGLGVGTFFQLLSAGSVS